MNGTHHLSACLPGTAEGARRRVASLTGWQVDRTILVRLLIREVRSVYPANHRVRSAPAASRQTAPDWPPVGQQTSAPELPRKVFIPRRQAALDRSWSRLGWPLLADDLWRILHTDSSGARSVEPAAAGLGLGAALLCELAVGEYIWLSHGLVLITPPACALLAQHGIGPRSGARLVGSSILADSIANDLLGTIVGEPEPLPVEDWFAYLAAFAYEKVAARMVSGGHVRPVAKWHPLRRRIAYPSFDLNVAGWPQARMAIAMDGRESLSDFDVMLAGLCRAMGLERSVFERWPAETVARACRIPNYFPPTFPDLLARAAEVLTASASRLR